MNRIPFNKPYLAGRELEYIQESIANGHISGNGYFTKSCHSFFENKYHFTKCLLTSSCTDALEMAAILLDIQPGDEVIIPSFTFVSTANAFVLRGASIRFIDSQSDNPNLNTQDIEALITPNTKAIIVVHYAGIACDMDAIKTLASKHRLFIVEDAAQAIDSYHNGKPLGGIGDLAAFSFHETKNIISGEGGMLVINNPVFEKRAEIIWEKGTNRSAFFKGEVNKYGWVDIGSSFLLSEITAAFLLAQLENLENIQQKRKEIWYDYMEGLMPLSLNGKIKLPFIPPFATNNAHMFYLVCNNPEDRESLIHFLNTNNIHSVFHYQSLHHSPYYTNKHDGRVLYWSDFYSGHLVRMPLFYELTKSDQQRIIECIKDFYEG